LLNKIMKKCKFCAEEIQNDAIKCKYCGSDLNEVAHDSKALNKKIDLSPRALRWIITIVVLIILISIFGFWNICSITITGGLIWFLWKKSKFNKKKKIIFTSVIGGIFILICILISYFNRAPSIKIISPEDKSSMQASSVLIDGKVSPKNSVLSINGAIIKLENGSFSYNFNLSDKTENNNITLKAKNNKKNTEKTLTITRIFTDEEKAMIEKAKQESELKAQKAKEEKIAKEKAELEAYYKTSAGKICKAHPTWSKNDCELLADRKIWVGMEYDMVKYLRGLPESVNTSNYGSGNQYQACWDYNYNPYCFYFGEDGIITSYN